jgi:4-amino-4-deoxy-L-arabinose transferase-like glycosyltransferase
MTEDSTGRKTLFVLTAILVLHFASLGLMALSDPTEARYADIALHMHLSKDYITPWVVVDGRLIPYWGKPPLHFWLTSASYSLFGISEWSARFPSFLAGLLVVLMTWHFARRLYGPRTAALSSVILASSPLFFFVYGASAVDASLSAAITGAMISFALAANPGNPSAARRWGILFFVFLALGMLTKGPVAPALVFLAIGLWLLKTRQWRRLRALPWKFGVPLFLLLSVPWFVLAEIRTPGFLRYFFINEHILRYLVHDYGDKYGSGHVYPPGTSWFMLLVLFLPWSAFLMYSWIRRWKAFRSRIETIQVWTSYLMIWGITPALFFMLSRQMLATYVLPGFAGLSVVVALELTNQRLEQYRRAAPAAALSLAALYAVAVLALHPLLDDKFSTKDAMSFVASDPRIAGSQILFPFEEPYSAQFYEEMFLHRQHTFTVDRGEALVDRLLVARSRAVLVFRQKHQAQLSRRLQATLIPIYESDNWIVCITPLHR